MIMVILLSFKWWGLERICGASTPKVVSHRHLDLKDDNNKTSDRCQYFQDLRYMKERLWEPKCVTFLQSEGCHVLTRLLLAPNFLCYTALTPLVQCWMLNTQYSWYQYWRLSTQYSWYQIFALHCSYSFGLILNAQYSVFSSCCNMVACRVIPFWYAWYLSCSFGTALSNKKYC